MLTDLSDEQIAEIQLMRDRVGYDEKRRLDSTLSGMTYADGIMAALEWILGDQSSEELLNL